jgi:hypothetical protein
MRASTFPWCSSTRRRRSLPRPATTSLRERRVRTVLTAAAAAAAHFEMVDDRVEQVRAVARVRHTAALASEREVHKVYVQVVERRLGVNGGENVRGRHAVAPRDSEAP